jgi:hypothetical protein
MVFRISLNEWLSDGRAARPAAAFFAARFFHSHWVRHPGAAVLVSKGKVWVEDEAVP